MEPIKLKHLLPEHLQEQIAAPNKRTSTSVLKNQPNIEQINSKEYNIAKTIFDAKGIFSDDERAAVHAILSIKDAAQWNKVDKFLKKLSKGRTDGIASYASSQDFLDIVDIQKILKHAKKIKADPGSITVLNNYSHPAELNWGNIDLSGTGLGSPIVLQALTDPEYRHQYLELLSLTTLFIPLIGPFVSSAIMLGDAAIYYKEGDRYNSGVQTIFAVLPLVGPIGRLISRIPGVGSVTTKMMANLGQKIALAKTNVNQLAKLLNPKELKIIKELIKNKNLVKSELNKYFQTMAKKAPSVIKNIGKKGNQVIKRIGNGSIKAAKAGGQLIKFGILTYAPYAGAEYAWDKVYYGLGLNKGDHEREVDYSISSDPDLYPTPGTNVYK